MALSFGLPSVGAASSTPLSYGYSYTSFGVDPSLLPYSLGQVASSTGASATGTGYSLGSASTQNASQDTNGAAGQISSWGQLAGSILGGVTGGQTQTIQPTQASYLTGQGGGISLMTVVLLAAAGLVVYEMVKK